MIIAAFQTEHEHSHPVCQVEIQIPVRLTVGAALVCKCKVQTADGRKGHESLHSLVTCASSPRLVEQQPRQRHHVRGKKIGCQRNRMKCGRLTILGYGA